MKICAPLSALGELNALLSAGADELYTGILEQSWQACYGSLLSPSRRYGSSAHLKSLTDLKQVIKISHSQGVKVFLTLNEHYLPEQFKPLLSLAKKAQALGTDGLILGDPAFLLFLSKQQIKLPLVMGVGGNVFNFEALRLYRELGVKRVILPRHLNLKEIRAFRAEFPDFQLECFIFRGLCPYLDGLCRFWHGINELLGKEPLEDLACGLKYQVKLKGKAGNSLKKSLKKLLSQRQSFTGCGLCALWELKRMGINSIKIVGREMPSEEKIAGTRLVKKARTKLEEKGISQSEFRKFCRELYQEFYRESCSALACYYPELCQAQKPL